MSDAYSKVEFYLKREMNSPSNHQEFAQAAEEKLLNYGAAMDAMQAALAALPEASPRTQCPDCGSLKVSLWSAASENIDAIWRCWDCNGDFKILAAAVPEASPRDPSPTPWDFSTWGFYCDACKVFFDLVKDGRVETHPGNICTRYHKCGKEARYIGYLRTAAVPEASEPSRRERHIYVDEATNTTHIGKPAAPEASGEPLAAQHEHTPHAFINALTGRDECIRCGGPEIAHAEYVREVSK